MSAKEAAASPPIQGYYAVRKGKGVKECIFVSWETAKVHLDVKDEVVEFSFFAKIEDALQYISNSAKSYADLCAQATGDKPGSPPPPGDDDDTDKKDDKTDSPKDGEKKRKGAPEGSDETSAKKSKAEGESKDKEMEKTEEAKDQEMKEAGDEKEGNKKEVDPEETSDKKSKAEGESKDKEAGGESKDKEEKAGEEENKKEEDKKEMDPEAAEIAETLKVVTNEKMESRETEQDEASTETEKSTEKTEETAPVDTANADAKANLNSSAPLNIILEQGFQQNLPKGWRSQHLGLYLNRRDYFKEPALKQYLQDLKDLQEYREGHFQPHRSEEKHFSGATHPMSVFYLNWAWGVCNSYHRDIRRQLKKNTPQAKGVEVPHFKAHGKGSDKVNNFNPKATKKPSPGNNKKSATESTEKSDVKQEEGSEPGKQDDAEAAPTKAIAEILEAAYTNFRHRGWRARDVLPEVKECDDEEEADIHKNYVAQLKRKNYSKELKKLEEFQKSNPDDLKKYEKKEGDPKTQHPSGFTSPYDVEFLKYSWDIKDEDLNALEKGTAVGPRPNRRALPIHPGAKPTAEVPSSSTAASGAGPAPEEATSAGNFSIMMDAADDDGTPQLIEALRANWFKGNDKGWRSIEQGLQVDPRSKTLTMAARKKREQLYIADLEVLKKWWKTYPSSQHYIFTVPDEGVDEESYKNQAYAASSKSARTDQKRHKSGINAPWSLTYLNWSWGVSNSYNRDLVRKEKRKAQYQKAVAASKEEGGTGNSGPGDTAQTALYI